MKTRDLAHIAIFLFVCLLYGNSIPNEYSFDDELVTDSNELVRKGVSGIPEIFTTNYVVHENYAVDYRPLVKLSYAIEHELFGANPYISHLINVLIYALTCMILFSVLCNLFRQYVLIYPILATALFIAHPIHTEVVNSLKNRDELLCFLFGLLALAALMRYIQKEQIKYLVIGVLVFLLALLSKLSAITFIAAIPLTLFFIDAANRRSTWISALILTVTAGGFIALELSMLPSMARHFYYIETPLAYVDDLAIKSASIFYSLGYYLRLLVVPHPLGFYYGFNQIPLVGWGNIWAIISLLVYGGLLLWTCTNILRRNTIAFGIGLYLIFVSPYSNVASALPGIVSERGLYAASLGFCIVLAYALLRFTGVGLKQYNDKLGVNKLMLGVSAIILGMYCLKTIDRNFDWKDRLSLISADINHLDNSAKAQQLYAYHLQQAYHTLEDTLEKSELIKKILLHYRKSSNIYPRWSLVQYELGAVYSRDLKEPGKAIPYYQNALALKAEYPDASFGLAQAYEQLGKPDSSVKYYRRTVQLNPKHFISLNKLAVHHYLDGDTSSAFQYNDQLLNVYPNEELPNLNAGNFCLFDNDTIAAIPYFEKVIEINPRNPKLLTFLANYFNEKGASNKSTYYRELAQNHATP